MDTILSQRTQPWANELLGTSKFYIHAYGSAITLLAEILGLTPLEVNEKLKAIGGFLPDEGYQVIWEKIVPAFPGWAAQFIAPYNNQSVLDALSKGQQVIVFADGAPNGMVGVQQAVRYMGGGKCHDPFTGTERPTLDFPEVKGFVVLTKVQVEQGVPSEPTTPAQETTPTTPESHLDPQPSVAVTLANLPMHEKKAILQHVETAAAEIKKILGL